MLLTAILGLFLVVSLGFNAYQYRRFKQIRRNPSWDTNQLLADLTRGVALVKISRIAPEDILLRSARGGI